VTSASSASAETPQATPDPGQELLAGRRVCEYSRAVARNPDGSDGVQVTILVNWKKRGACLTLSEEKFRNMTGFTLQGPQPVSKITCEQGAIFLVRSPWGVSDLCTQMLEDDVYKFTYDPATDKTGYVDYGNARTSNFM
jgi:hypothetical protein